MTAGLEALDTFGGPPAEPGSVALVGAGPGDAGLLTLRAVRLLSSCDVVAYDYLAPADALALVPPHAERICVGRRAGGPAVDRREADDLIVARAQQGHAVVRLKGGDPYVFGRGGLEAQLCRAAGIPCEVVAGVTSAIAVPGAAGIPVTHRMVSAGFAVVTAHEAPGKTEEAVDYDALARFPGTLVFMMGTGQIRRIADRLIAAGKQPDTLVALVRWGTTAEQDTLEATLATVAEEVERRGFAPPAVTVVGDVVGLREHLPSREKRPLHGVRVLVPRTSDRPSRLAAHLRALGAAPVEVPVARTQPTDDSRMRPFVRRLTERGYEVLAFDGPRAIERLAEQLRAHDLDARALAGVRVATAGEAASRAASLHLGVLADVASRDTRTLPMRLGEGPGRVLLLRAHDADGALPDRLRAMGWSVDVASVSRTVGLPNLPGDVADELCGGAFPYVVLPSSAAAEHFGRLAAHLPSAARVVSIGRRTTASARGAGLRVAAEAATADLHGLGAAVARLAVTAPASNELGTEVAAVG